MAFCGYLELTQKKEWLEIDPAQKNKHQHLSMLTITPLQQATLKLFGHPINA
jgi:hypothetical protein